MYTSSYTCDCNCIQCVPAATISSYNNYLHDYALCPCTYIHTYLSQCVCTYAAYMNTCVHVHISVSSSM